MGPHAVRSEERIHDCSRERHSCVEPGISSFSRRAQRRRSLFLPVTALFSGEANTP